MKRMMKMLRKMKKNNNEGFSLVELIIVISIMAILMGVVATQVLPYLNRTKETNDNTILSKMHTAAVSAFSFQADKLKAEDIMIKVVSGSETAVAARGGGAVVGGNEVVADFRTLLGVTTGQAFTYFNTNATSPDGAKVDKIEIIYNGSGNGKITVQAYNGGTKLLKTIESK